MLTTMCRRFSGFVVKKRVAVIHAMLGSVPPTVKAFDDHFPEAQLQHIIDSSLSVDVKSTGLSQQMHERFLRLAEYAKLSATDGILFSCSAFGSCIEHVQHQITDIPVLKPNEAMMEDAVLKYGGGIGVLSVFQPTLPSIQRELTDLALKHEKSIEIHSVFVDSMHLLQNERVEEYHDSIANAAVELASAHDLSCILLAMFSMASAGKVVRKAIDVPVLTSPETAVLKLKGLLLC